MSFVEFYALSAPFVRTMKGEGESQTRYAFCILFVDTHVCFMWVGRVP